MDAADLYPIYQVTWRGIAEGPSLNIHRCETLKFHISYKVRICWEVPNDESGYRAYLPKVCLTEDQQVDKHK